MVQHGPAWSNKGKYMLVRNIHSDSGWIVHVGKNIHSDDIEFKDYHELNYQDTLSFYINMSHPGGIV